MGNFRTTTLTSAIFTAIAISYPATVKADEVFLCDNGRIVKVALQDLEWMKQNDPCVASHYGLQARSVMVPPLPQRGPLRVTAKAAKQPNSIVDTGRIETATIRKPAVAENSEPGVPAFRKVRIINAQKGGRRFFRHRY